MYLADLLPSLVNSVVAEPAKIVYLPAGSQM